jgi:hypothetical protein
MANVTLNMRVNYEFSLNMQSIFIQDFYLNFNFLQLSGSIIQTVVHNAGNDIMQSSMALYLLTVQLHSCRSPIPHFRQ